MTTPLVAPRIKFTDSNDEPLAGGKLYSYIAGTSTPKATYTDSTGATPNANPVILNASGEANVWLSGSYKFKLTDSADVEQWTIDNIKEFLVTASGGAFTLVDSAPIVTGATTFTVAGDQTAYFFINQRVKFTTTSTTVYARVNSAVFGAGVTTVTLSNGAINVGTPTGAYVGLGNAGLPIDALQVAYGTAANVGDTLTALEADVVALEALNAGAAAPLRQGLHTIPYLATAMISAAVNGAASGVVALAGGVMLATLDFDQATSESVQFYIPACKSWNGGTVTAQLAWTAASGAGTVTWVVSAVAVGNDETLDATFGTPISVTDTLTTANRKHTTDVTAAITIGGSIADGDLLIFKIARDIADTLTADAKLISVDIFVTLDAANDA